MTKLKIGRLIARPIIIDASSNNGFIVKSGCGKFVASSIDDLLEKLKNYLDDIEGYENQYNKMGQDETVEVASGGQSEAREESPQPRRGLVSPA